MSALNWIGLKIMALINEMGLILLLLIDTARWSVMPPFRVREIFRQMEFVGVKSAFVVILTGAFTGMVLAFQSFHGFRQFNAESLVGTVVGLSMTRELGPVLTGFMVTARAGSAMAAELGTMRVTEQIDALHSLATDPVEYLIVPRVIAAIIMLPVLTIVADVFGIAGGYFVGVPILGINSHVYTRKMWDLMEMSDVFNGLIKSAFFGLIAAHIGCYKGYNAKGGAEGVGRATTSAVVLGAVLILIADYFLTALMFD